MHGRIQEFLPGGSRPDCQKTALTMFNSGLSMVYFKENYDFPRFHRGSNIFQGWGGGGGGNFFQGGGGGSKC